MTKKNTLLKKVICEYGKTHEVFSVAEVIKPYKCSIPKEHKNVDRPKITEKKS